MSSQIERILSENIGRYTALDREFMRWMVMDYRRKLGPNDRVGVYGPSSNYGHFTGDSGTYVSFTYRNHHYCRIPVKAQTGSSLLTGEGNASVGKVFGEPEYCWAGFITRTTRGRLTATGLKACIRKGVGYMVLEDGTLKEMDPHGWYTRSGMRTDR